MSYHLSSFLCTSVIFLSLDLWYRKLLTTRHLVVLIAVYMIRTYMYFTALLTRKLNKRIPKLIFLDSGESISRKPSDTSMERSWDTSEERSWDIPEATTNYRCMCPPPLGLVRRKSARKFTPGGPVGVVLFVYMILNSPEGGRGDVLFIPVTVGIRAVSITRELFSP